MREKAATLYLKFGPVIFARCRRLLGDDTEAEDATQEVFLRVAVHLDEAVSSNEAILWIHRVATNYCLNELRNRRRRPREDPTWDDSVEGEPDNEEALANRDLARRINDRSPSYLAAPANLHYVEGWSQTEVGRALGLSRRTVINYLSEFRKRALRMVRREP